MNPRGGRFLLLCVMILYKSNGVICEAQNEETRLVFGTRGGDVTLQLNRDDVEDVSWVYDGDVRITTKPGEPITIRDPNHKGNMEATKDASLVIMNLSQDDQKVYSASLQLKTTQEIYIIRYDLKVYKILSTEDVQFESNITSAEPCNILINCVVKEPNVNVSWTNRSALNATGNSLYIVDARSSLNLTCTAQNPISNVTRTVKPLEFCKAMKTGGAKNVRTGIVVVAVFAFVGIAGFFIYRRLRNQAVSEEAPTVS